MGITSSMENFKAGVASDLANARDASMDQMINNQKKLQLRIRETQIAVNIAFLRDNFKWYCAFYGTITPLCILGAVKTKSPGAVAPIVPLTYALAFQYDAAYGNKTLRVREEAEAILAAERERMLLPKNSAIATPSEYDSFFPEEDKE